jgi:hypothetical protein
MKARITNYDELKAEIYSLKIRRTEQELYFLQKREKIENTFSSPLNFVKTLIGLRNSRDNKHSAFHKSGDWATSFARIVVPFLLNKTFFRGRGVLIKSLLAMFSQKIISGDNINQGKVIGWIDGVSNWINSTLKKKKKRNIGDYGIPPDSETY